MTLLKQNSLERKPDYPVQSNYKYGEFSINKPKEPINLNSPVYLMLLYSWIGWHPTNRHKDKIIATGFILAVVLIRVLINPFKLYQLE